MKIVMTLLVRDEEDILEAHLAFHVAAGVDHFIVTDHASQDGTTAILERHAKQGTVSFVRETDSVKRQAEWVTRMAREAATDHQADWVINSDADEFWWPSGGDLKTVLARVPEHFGVVTTFVRPFLPGRGEGRFLDRMTIRLAPPAPFQSPTTSFRANVRLLHRAAPDVVVGFGNATVSGDSLGAELPSSQIEVLHFPIRSFEQYEQKFRTKHRTGGTRQRGDSMRAVAAVASGRLHDMYDEMSLDHAGRQRGLEEGSLVLDTRLRDALSALSEGTSPVFASRDAADAAAFAVDGDVLEATQLVRLTRRVDETSSRVAALHQRRRFPGLVPRRDLATTDPASATGATSSASDRRSRRPRSQLRTALALSLVVFGIFVLLPEALRDRPYDPRPSRVVSVLEHRRDHDGAPPLTNERLALTEDFDATTDGGRISATAD